MVSKVRELLSREIKNLHEAAYLLAFFSILSQFFALFRDRLLAGNLGTGIELDIYYTAFKLPDLIFVFVSALVSISVLVPLFVKKIEKTEELKKLVDSIFTVLSFISVFILIIAFFFTPKFLQIIVPDLFNSNLGDELIMITRIMLIQPILLAISSFMGSLVQAYKKFTIYAFSPILYNLGIILGILVFYPVYGLPGLAYGVVVGAFMHLFLQIPFIFEEGIYPKLTSKIDIKKIFYIVSNSLPRTASMFANQGILIFMTFLASTMTYGSISIFNLSYNLQAVPFVIIGVSYSLAAFPTLSKYFQQKRFDDFYENISKALRHIIFWSLPVMAMFIVLRAQIVRVILGTGNFDWESTRLVAAALAIFTVSIFAQSISLLFLRAYYSMEKTLKPFLITLVSFFTIILSSFIFLNLFNSNFSIHIKELLRLTYVSDISILALPAAFSVGQIIQMILLIVFFGNIKKYINKDLFRAFSQSLSASFVAFLVTFLGLNILDTVFDLDTFIGIFMQGFVAGVGGLVSAFVFLVVIGNKEVKIAIGTIRRKFWETKVISPEIEEEI